MRELALALVARSLALFRSADAAQRELAVQLSKISRLLRMKYQGFEKWFEIKIKHVKRGSSQG